MGKERERVGRRGSVARQEQRGEIAAPLLACPSTQVSRFRSAPARFLQSSANWTARTNSRCQIDVNRVFSLCHRAVLSGRSNENAVFSSVAVDSGLRSSRGQLGCESGQWKSSDTESALAQLGARFESSLRLTVVHCSPIAALRCSRPTLSADWQDALLTVPS